MVDEKDNVHEKSIMYVFDEVVSIRATGGIVKIAVCHLASSIFFREYFAQYGTEADVPANEPVENVHELCKFLRNGNIPTNKAESLKLMHKWGIETGIARKLFNGIYDLSIIPNVQLDYFKPFIEEQMKIHMFSVKPSGACGTTCGVAVTEKVRKQILELPAHVLSEICKVMLNGIKY